jgi:hypothetical protein
MMSSKHSMVMLCLVMVLGACGDDDSVTTTAAGTTSPTATTAPTELRFTFEGIVGLQGKTLVGTVFAATGGVVGTVCVPVTADPFTGTAVVATASPDNPCGHEPPYGVPLTAAGTYDFLVAAYTPGSQTAEVCFSSNVTFDGPTQIVVGTSNLSEAGCPA